MAYSEHTLQLQCLAVYKRLLPANKPELENLLFAVPNGANVNQANRGRLKSEGLRNGWPDLGLCLPDGKVLWFELKRPELKAYDPGKKKWQVVQKGGVTSPEQLKIHALLRSMGHEVILITDVQQFADAITKRGRA